MQPRAEHFYVGISSKDRAGAEYGNFQEAAAWSFPATQRRNCISLRGHGRLGYEAATVGSWPLML
jgi:hypothetical protein